MGTCQKFNKYHQTENGVEDSILSTISNNDNNNENKLRLIHGCSHEIRICTNMINVVCQRNNIIHIHI